ncbi:hypothetical protein [Photobacterium sp. 53610]|uniref:hypothetical protein n=1 Tax=Photobacterium sp. 53610 TaxID=3102789 RepID=UPI002ED84CA4
MSHNLSTLTNEQRQHIEADKLACLYILRMESEHKQKNPMGRGFITVPAMSKQQVVKEVRAKYPALSELVFDCIRSRNGNK